MILDAVCDICGKKSSGYQDYDGADLCEKCEIEKELDYLRRQRKEKWEWIKDCWIKELNEMSKEITELENKLKEM